MLPGLRFILATVVLSVSVLIFGLGAAALLRATHEEVAVLPSLRTMQQQPIFAQQIDIAPPTLALALLRVETPSPAFEELPPVAETLSPVAETPAVVELSSSAIEAAPVMEIPPASADVPVTTMLASAHEAAPATDVLSPAAEAAPAPPSRPSIVEIAPLVPTIPVPAVETPLVVAAATAGCEILPDAPSLKVANTLPETASEKPATADAIKITKLKTNPSSAATHHRAARASQQKLRSARRQRARVAAHRRRNIARARLVAPGVVAKPAPDLFTLLFGGGVPQRTN